MLGDRSHESIGRDLILSGEISDIIRTHGLYRIDPEEVAYIATGEGEAPNQAALVAKEMIAGDLGVDRMDYLRRDSYMCGVAYGMFDLHRLVATLMLARREDDGTPALALERGGVNAAEGLLAARYFMFSQVYFHHVRVMYDEHLIRFLRSYLPDGRYPENDVYLSYDDIEVMSLLRNNAEQDVHARAITAREHFRMVYGRDADPSTDFDIEAQLTEGLERFGDRAIIRSSSKSAVALQRGDVLVVDPLSGRVADILDRSQMLAALGGVGYLRVFAHRDIKDEVQDEVQRIVGVG